MESGYSNNNKKIIKETKSPDELYDITVLGYGSDEEGKTVCHLEEHEYMLGYPDEE